MNTGIETRFMKLVSAFDNRSLCIACDHGLMTDPGRSWLQISEVVQAATQEHADGLLLSGGQIHRFVSERGRGSLPAFIVRTDWTNLLRVGGKSGEKDKLVLPVSRFMYRRLINAKEVLFRYAGSAAIGFLFVDPGGSVEALTLKTSRELISECHEIGLPCMIEVLPLMLERQTADPDDLLRRGIQTALELGADAIKMPLTEKLDDLCKLIHQAGKRVFILGGGNLSDEDLFLNLMQKAVDTGVDGLLVGRNVSNSPDPVGLIAKLRSMVHPELQFTGQRDPKKI